MSSRQNKVSQLALSRVPCVQHTWPWRCSHRSCRGRRKHPRNLRQEFHHPVTTCKQRQRSIQKESHSHGINASVADQAGTRLQNKYMKNSLVIDPTNECTAGAPKTGHSCSNSVPERVIKNYRTLHECARKISTVGTRFVCGKWKPTVVVAAALIIGTIMVPRKTYQRKDEQGQESYNMEPLYQCSIAGSTIANKWHAVSCVRCIHLIHLKANSIPHVGHIR